MCEEFFIFSGLESVFLFWEIEVLFFVVEFYVLIFELCIVVKDIWLEFFFLLLLVDVWNLFLVFEDNLLFILLGMFWCDVIGIVIVVLGDREDIILVLFDKDGEVIIMEEIGELFIWILECIREFVIFWVVVVVIVCDVRKVVEVILFLFWVILVNEVVCDILEILENFFVVINVFGLVLDFFVVFDGEVLVLLENKRVVWDSVLGFKFVVF